MNLYFSNQRKQMLAHLQRMKVAKIMACKKFELREEVTEILLDTPFADEHFKAVLDHYRIFPENILAACCEFEVEKRPMRVGDVIVQQVFLPPVPRVSLCLIMGVRITEVIDEPSRKGFTYKTLRGHAEKGVSTFTFEKHPKGTIFRIHTFSKSAIPLLGFLARPYQSFSTRRALTHVARQLESNAIDSSFATVRHR